MIKEQLGPRFSYKAHAVGVAGKFTTPRPEFLEAQASCALPTTGGSVTVRAAHFNYRDLVSFRSSQTTCIGFGDTPDQGPFHTLVTTTVEGLNIMGVVTADRVVARLASRHTMDEKEEPAIVTVGSHIENLRVGGELIAFDHDNDVQSTDKFSNLKTLCLDRSQMISDNLLLTSIFTNLGSRSFKPHRNRIDFPQLGSIFLGEILISGRERQLTMIRIKFGCAMEGDFSCCEVAGNGRPMPPPI